ncbi:hypothetical protein QUB33_28825, partial [Microcoleus sp. B3-A4]|uniref:hypothetical protein n=1 Tax=Microcoleus sp. B3-A4 TaxID=2818653 RepID=UPI002FD197C7
VLNLSPVTLLNVLLHTGDFSRRPTYFQTRNSNDRTQLSQTFDCRRRRIGKLPYPDEVATVTSPRQGNRISLIGIATITDALALKTPY